MTNNKNTKTMVLNLPNLEDIEWSANERAAVPNRTFTTFKNIMFNFKAKLIFQAKFSKMNF